MTRDSLKRVARTFLVAFVAILLPGLFGWLNGLTAWAKSEGQTPFPDAHSLAFLGISAIVAGVIAALNLLLNLVEDQVGHGILRDVPPNNPGENGSADTLLSGIIGVVGLVMIATIMGLPLWYGIAILAALATALLLYIAHLKDTRNTTLG